LFTANGPVGSEEQLKKLIFSLFVVGAFAFASTAQAAEVFCPTGLDSGDASATQRIFGVTTTTGPDAECFSFGTGNNPDPIAVGYTLIDKEQDGSEEAAGLVLTGLGTTGGTFSFNVSLWSSFSNLILVLKSGEGQRDPDWAAFDLDPLTISGLWNIYPPGTQSLSHASLYGLATGTGTPPPPPPIPEPASLTLLGTGLVFAASRFRRRKT
jgi:PEP-CTERM motif